MTPHATTRSAVCADCGAGFEHAARRGPVAKRCPRCRAPFVDGKARRLARAAARIMRHLVPCTACGRPFDRVLRGIPASRCGPCAAIHRSASRKMEKARYRARKRAARLANPQPRKPPEHGPPRPCAGCAAVEVQPPRRWCADCKRERVRAVERAKYAADPEAARAKRAANRRRHPWAHVLCEARRRARRHGAEVLPVSSADVDRVFEVQSGRCGNPYCGAALDRTRARSVHVDHRVPFRDGGAHELANLQLLCASCNARKHRTPWPAFVRAEGR